MIVLFMRDEPVRGLRLAAGSRRSAACSTRRARALGQGQRRREDPVLGDGRAAGLTLCVTGLILDFPNFNQTRQTMQVANVIHMIAGSFAIVPAAGHIYLGTIGMEGAWEAMRTGYVDETWAREHHEYWYNDVKAGKVDRRGGAARAQLPRERVA